MLQSGQTLFRGRYQLVRHLRAGGAGVVWEGVDLRPGRGQASAVALKILDAHNGGAEAAERESEVSKRVVHPLVVTVRHSFVEDGLAFLVMDLAWGSLNDLVTLYGPMAPPAAVGCALQAAQALAEAHRVGVIHRDVKPHNLLVFPDGQVRLADFGVARARADAFTRTRTGALVGSIPFMAPEQRRDARAVLPATDVYSLAVTLAFLLLGDSTDEPWTPEAAGALAAAGVPDRLVALIAAAGARRAEHRPENGEAMVARLRACGVVADVAGLLPMVALPLGAEAAAPAPPRHVAAPPPPPPPPRWRWRVAIGLALAFGLGLGRVLGGAPPLEPGADRLPACAITIGDWSEDVRKGPEETVSGVLADVDLDGHLDAIFSNQGAETATIWWGERGQLPTQQVEVPIGRTGAPVAVADVDSDGLPDLLAALQDDSAIAEMRGAGARTFHPVTRVFQNPPPTSLAVFSTRAAATRLIFSELQGNLNIRDRSGVWQRHRNLMNEEDGARIEGIVPDSGSFHVLMQGARGARSRSHDRSPLALPPLVRWISSPSSQVEDWTLYGVTGDRDIVQLSAGAPPCVLGKETTTWRYAALGDLDGDGVLDAISHATCRHCTSNQVFLRGIRGGRAG